MINNKSISSPKIEKQKKRPTNLYWLLKTHPKLWMLYDVVIVILALKAAYLFYAQYMFQHFFLIEYFCFLVFFLLAGSIVGLYERNAFNSFTKLFLSLFATISLALIGLFLLKNIFLYEQIGRRVLVFVFAIIIVGCGLTRLIFGSYIKRFILRILFVCDEKQALGFKNHFEPNIGYYDFVGYCDDSLNKHILKLGNISEIDDICRTYRIDLVVIEDDYIRRPSIFDKCLNVVKLDCAIVDKETFIEQSFEQVVVDEIDPVWFYRANLGVRDDFQWILKRSIDVFFAVVGLFFTALLFPFIWIAIKLNSPGPVLYSQTRCGRFDKEFKIYKFRTMRIDAEIDGAVWAKENDERITKIGNVLRKTRLDELPQFWNILIGDMSLVGPRPERPEMVKEIEEKIPYFYFRHLVKPGVTGFAQIRYRYGASIEDAKEKLKYDLYYVKNWSFFMDMQIILRTIVTIMKGAR